MSHLTHLQRYTISSMLSAGYNQIQIANAINKDKSVVSREINRNKDNRNGVYKADLAHNKCNLRHQNKPKQIRFTASIKLEIEALLKKDYSPEQVVNTLIKLGKPTVSTERIYQHIWEDKKRKGLLYKHLRCQGKRYRKRGASKDSRGIIKNRIGIEKRPSIVEERKRFGDLEVDLIIGKDHEQAILTLNDRASGVLKMRKVASKNAMVVSQAMIEELDDWLPYLKTVTADNGKEFAEHQYVAEQLNIDYYFARPYSPWERGSNENLNGLIRQYFPKKTDFKSITNQQIKEVEDKLNNRPRKRHNYQNPIFVMNQLLFNQEVAFIT